MAATYSFKCVWDQAPPPIFTDSYTQHWCFQTVGLEKTLESSLDCKEIKQVNPKGNQSWTFIGRTDAEAETPILWPPDAKKQLIGKDPDAGKDWEQEEKGTTEDEMLRWHHWLNGHESEQTPGDSEAQRRLVCCSPWGCKESYMTERLDKNGCIKHIENKVNPYCLCRSGGRDNYHEKLKETILTWAEDNKTNYCNRKRWIKVTLGGQRWLLWGGMSDLTLGLSQGAGKAKIWGKRIPGRRIANIESWRPPKFGKSQKETGGHCGDDQVR